MEPQRKKWVVKEVMSAREVSRKSREIRPKAVMPMTRNVQRLLNKGKHKRDGRKSAEVDKQRETSQPEKPINRGSLEV